MLHLPRSTGAGSLLLLAVENENKNIVRSSSATCVVLSLLLRSMLEKQPLASVEDIDTRYTQIQVQYQWFVRNRGDSRADVVVAVATNSAARHFGMTHIHSHIISVLTSK